LLFGGDNGTDLLGIQVLLGFSGQTEDALGLVSIMVSEESAKEVERIMCYEWKKGIVVDGIDV